MDFSLTTLFVLPDGSVKANGFARENLGVNEFGIFNSRYKAVADATEAVKSPYLVFGQGRIEQVPGLTHKYSDKVYPENLVEWYKTTAVQTATTQISYIGYDGTDTTKSIKAGCDEVYSLKVRVRSLYIDNAFAYGLTRTVTVTTPCCADCTENCDKIDPRILANAFADKINAEPELSKFITATEVEVSTDGGTTFVAGVKLESKTLDKYGNPCDPIAYPYEYDKITFEAFAYKGAATSQDSTDVYNRCENIPYTLKQASSFISGSGEEIFELEKKFYSYQTTLKHIFHLPAYNGGFERYSVPATFYDTYVIRFKAPNSTRAFSSETAIEESVVLALPTGTGGTIEDILSGYLGTAKFTAGTLLP